MNKGVVLVVFVTNKGLFMTTFVTNKGLFMTNMLVDHEKTQSGKGPSSLGRFP
jgi:hypothetical protein